MVCVSGGRERLTPGQVGQIVAQIGPPAGTTVEQWIAKADEETDFRPKCVNEIKAVGLWQVRHIHAGSIPGAPSDRNAFIEWLKVPSNNFQAAKYLYEQAGSWQPWNASGGAPDVSREHQLAANASLAYGPGGVNNLGDAPTPGDIVSAVANLGRVIENFVGIVVAAAKWIGDPANWLRIVQVGGGITLALLATTLVAKPLVEETKRTVSPF